MRFLCCFDRHHDQKHIGGGKGQLHFQSIMKGSQNGTGGTGTEPGTTEELCILAFCSWFALFALLHTCPETALPRVAWASPR